LEKKKSFVDYGTAIFFGQSGNGNSAILKKSSFI